jgi:hypothetical protein
MELLERVGHSGLRQAYPSSANADDPLTRKDDVVAGILLLWGTLVDGDDGKPQKN